METFTVEELAGDIKLHEYTARRLSRAGKIPFLRKMGRFFNLKGRVKNGKRS